MNDPGCVCVWLTGVGEPSGWEEDGRTTGRGEGDKRTTRRSKGAEEENRTNTRGKKTTGKKEEEDRYRPLAS